MGLIQDFNQVASYVDEHVHPLTAEQGREIYTQHLLTAVDSFLRGGSQKDLVTSYHQYAYKIQIEQRLFVAGTTGEINSIFLAYNLTSLSVQDWITKIRKSPINDKINMCFGIYIWSDTTRVTVIQTTLPTTPVANFSEIINPYNSLYALLSETDLRVHLNYLRKANLL